MTSQQTPADLGAIIRGRRTIENFREQSPPQEAILQAIELACWAPNHKHTEPWLFHLLGPEAAARLVDLNTRIVRQTKGDAAAEARHARWSRVPGWLVITCDRSDDPTRAEEDYAACCCAAQNLALSLWTCGIGVKWSTGPVTRTEEFAHLIGMHPEDRKVVGLFAYGYPATIPEGRRRGLNEVLKQLP